MAVLFFQIPGTRTNQQPDICNICGVSESWVGEYNPGGFWYQGTLRMIISVNYFQEFLA